MNRALEFLREAHGLLSYPDSCNAAKARLLVRLALGEVEELLARRLEAQHIAPPTLPKPSDGRVIVVEANMQRAQLKERPFLYTEKAVPRLAIDSSHDGEAT